MYTIIDSTTGKVLFAKFDNIVLEGQIAIEKICTLETDKEIFFNFETNDYYTK
jgi:hypothetical protein